jgi:zinc/manganese transport system ATP-binding protein
MAIDNKVVEEISKFFSFSKKNQDNLKDEVVINIEGVDTVYEGARVPSLYDVNLKIKRGEYVLIVGPNGAGKTTLLETILGLLKVKVGNIRVFNHPLDKARSDIRRKIGYVLQNFEMDPNQPFIVKDIVMIGRVAYRGSGKPTNEQDWDAVRRSLRLLGMEQLMERPIGKLSGGQQQKTLIAQALSKQPEILLLDEPFANLDLDTQEKFFKLLSLMKKQGVTILMVSHGVQIPPDVDRIVMINKGRIVINNSLENACENPLFEKYLLMEQANKNWNRIKNGA